MIHSQWNRSFFANHFGGNMLTTLDTDASTYALPSKIMPQRNTHSGEGVGRDSLGSIQTLFLFLSSFFFPAHVNAHTDIYIYIYIEDSVFLLPAGNISVSAFQQFFALFLSASFFFFLVLFHWDEIVSLLIEHHWTLAMPGNPLVPSHGDHAAHRGTHASTGTRYQKKKRTHTGKKGEG